MALRTTNRIACVCVSGALAAVGGVGSGSACAASGPLGGEVETVRFDLTELSLAIFGVSFGVDYVSPGAGTVVEVRLHLEYTTETAFGTYDAADIAIEMQGAAGELPFWTFHGEDLGWSGAGRFSADLVTHDLDGCIAADDPDVMALWFVRMFNWRDAVPMGGQWIGSYYEVDIILPGPACVGDITGDGAVTTSDLTTFLGAFGSVDGDRNFIAAADLTGDGAITTSDLTALLGVFGDVCEGA